MASTVYVAPTKNFIQKTLNGAITNNATSITLNNTTNMQSPGYVVIDRVDANGTVLASTVRETISYTGISGNQLTGCVRSTDGEGGVGLAHGDQAIVEQTLTEGMWNSLVTIVATGFDNNGLLNPLVSPISISQLFIKTLINASGASVVGLTTSDPLTLGTVNVTTLLNASGASINGISRLYPVFSFVGTLSGPTTAIQSPLTMPLAGTFAWVSLKTRTQASTASVIIDVNVNGVSIFDTATRPTLALGATYVSTASIKTRAFTMGAELNWDFKNGFITDFVVQGGTI